MLLLAIRGITKLSVLYYTHIKSDHCAHHASTGLHKFCLVPSFVKSYPVHGSEQDVKVVRNPYIFLPYLRTQSHHVDENSPIISAFYNNRYNE